MGRSNPKPYLTYKFRIKRRFGCTFDGCIRTYSTSSNRNAHMRKKHPQVIAAESMMSDVQMTNDSIDDDQTNANLGNDVEAEDNI
jgi:uncharacterized OB-fold protein